MKKFEIKVNTITTDNAPNIVLAADNLLNENETLPIKAIRCACHILNLIVQFGYDDASMSDLIEKLNIIAKEFIHLRLLNNLYLIKQSYPKNLILKSNWMLRLGGTPPII